MNVTILSATPGLSGIDISGGYFIGGVIAFFLLGYLLYSLIKPEKF